MCARPRSPSLSQVPLYDALAVDYDRFVNWQGRLSHELPFFASLFERHGVRRVLLSLIHISEPTRL